MDSRRNARRSAFPAAAFAAQRLDSAFYKGWRAAAGSAGFIILQFIRDVLKRHPEMEAPDWLSALLAANS
jgi:hypothetical protein